MMRTILLSPFTFLVCALSAQQPAAPPKVVKSEAKEMKTDKGGAPVVAIAQDSITWTYTGAFDQGPAHPDCAAMAGSERDACTAQRVLQAIRSQGTANSGAVALVVEVAFGVNEYGEVKDIGIQGIADGTFMRKVIVALSAMPRFAYASKGGTRMGSRCAFRIPAAMILAKEAK